MTTINVNPRRGEIWWVHFDPSVGQELRKTRPAVILSSDAFSGRVRVKIVIPLTTWQERFKDYQWMVKILKNQKNWLNADSAVDPQQIKSVMCTSERFGSKLGCLTDLQMAEITTALAIIIEHE